MHFDLNIEMTASDDRMMYENDCNIFVLDERGLFKAI